MAYSLNSVPLAGKVFLTSAVLSLLIVGLLYGETQHVLRSSANDPQIQEAQDIAATISRDGLPANKVPSFTVDMKNSLNLFVNVYDSSGAVVGGSGLLDGKVPVPPQGVFTTAKRTGENRLTWQPQPGVRIATVVTPYQGRDSGFVVVGRSLKETEVREHDTLIMALIGWIIMVIASAILSALFFRKKPAHEHHTA